MPVYLCTLDQAKTEINTQTVNATEETRIMQDIAWASGRILNLLDKKGVDPEPIVRTRKYNAKRGSTLLLNRALAELTSITLGDTRQPTASDYMLEPETAPYSMLEVFNSYSWAAYTNTPTQANSVAGVWAWHTAYANAWLSVTTLNGGIDASVTSIIVTSATNLRAGQLFRVETEYMRISSIVTNTLTVERGVNGSTAAAHLTGVDVGLWRPDDLIVRATTKTCSLLYERRGAFAQVTYDGLTAQTYPTDLPGEVVGILSEIPAYFIGMSA